MAAYNFETHTNYCEFIQN